MDNRPTGTGRPLGSRGSGDTGITFRPLESSRPNRTGWPLVNRLNGGDALIDQPHPHRREGADQQGQEHADDQDRDGPVI